MAGSSVAAADGHGGTRSPRRSPDRSRCWRIRAGWRIGEHTTVFVFYSWRSF